LLEVDHLEMFEAVVPGGERAAADGFLGQPEPFDHGADRRVADDVEAGLQAGFGAVDEVSGDGVGVEVQRA